MPIPRRRSFPPTAMRPSVTCGISTGFPVLSPCGGQVAYALLTSAPVAAGVLPHRDAPRLACVKPAASVHPEPGSNSPLFYYFILFFSAYSSTERRCPASCPCARHRVLDGGLPPSSFHVFLLSRNAYCCILSMCSYSRPAKGRTAKIGNLSGTRNSATRFFRKKIAGGGVAPRGRAPFPFCVCKGTHIAPDTQERRGLFSGRGDRKRRKTLCDTAL